MNLFIYFNNLRKSMEKQDIVKDLCMTYSQEYLNALNNEN